MLTLKICARVFLRSIVVRILELNIYMDDELRYGVIENQAHCSYSSLYLSIFLSFQGNFVSQFFQELIKLESLTLINICRMSVLWDADSGSWLFLF